MGLNMSMSVTVKASIWVFLLLCILQIAAPVIALQYPAVGPMEDGVGYPHPWFPSWAMFSCASTPLAIINLVIAVFALCAVSGPHDCRQGKDVPLLWGIVIVDICIVIFAGLLFFVSQLGFVPPPGSS